MRVAEREELSKSIIKTNLKNINSTGQGNFKFVRKKSGKSQGISKTSGCGNHAWLNFSDLSCWNSSVCK